MTNRDVKAYLNRHRRQILVVVLGVLSATLIYVLADWYLCLPADALQKATYVGRQVCAECHPKETELWSGSYHDLAMDRATAETVLGNFNNVEFTHFAFDHLPLLTDDELRLVLEKTQISDLALALHDSPEQLRTRVSRLLPPERRQELEKLLDWQFAVRPCDQIEAYRRIDDVMRALAAEGKLRREFAVTSRFFTKNGKFFVETDNAEGKLETFQVKYVLGVYPLQQYLVEFPDGRIQCLPLAWDSKQNRWFHLYPKEPIPHTDVLHWTKPLQNWNYMCADCHTTNLQKNYDVKTNTYHTTWSEIDVSCEACHGPGSVHVELARSWSLFWDRKLGYGLANLKSVDPHKEIETCAPCHARRRIVYPGFRPGNSFYDYYVPETIEGNLYYADGQILEEDYVYGSFIQSLMYRKGVRCSNCHDPHSLRIRTESPDQPPPDVTDNKVCGQCHLPSKYDTPNHHHHPNTGGPGTHCVECHMPETKYMVVDPRRDHSIRIPRPDLTIALGIPNACNLCHNDPEKGEDAHWAEKWCQEWYGPRKGPRHFAYAIDAGRRLAPQAVDELAQLSRRQDLSAMVRASTLALLAQYHNDKGLAACVAALEDPDPLVRTIAVRALDWLPPTESQRWLLRMLRDPIRSVRCEAGRILSALRQDLLAADDRAWLSRAIEEYLTGQQSLSDQPGAHLNMAVVYANLGEFSRAIDHYQTALRIDPNFFPAYNNLAMLYDRLGKKQEAEEILRRWVKVQPDNAQPYYYLGLLLAEDEQRLPEACQLLQKAAKLSPNTARIQYNYGLACLKLGKAAEAETALRDAVIIEPANTDYWYALFSLYMQQDQPTKALECLEELEKLEPHNPRWQALKQMVEASKY